MESLHSGSISFGRFEAESLSWERRSSFSHNRYLEEVEKYSKPGSVTEMKAYFEAHFKKKALLSQSSSECQNGTEYQTSENDISENMHNGDEFGHLNRCSHSAHFDESLAHLEYGREYEKANYEGGRGVLYSEPQVEAGICGADVADTVSVHVIEVAQQNETGNFLLSNTEQEKEVKESPDGEELHVNMTCKAIFPPLNSHTSDKEETACLGHEQNPSLKVKNSSETKATQTRLKSQVIVEQVQRNISSEASTKVAGRPDRNERGGSLRTKTEKQLAQTAAPNTRSMRKTSKPEECNSTKAKLTRENKSSRIASTAQKGSQMQSSASEKIVPGACQTSSRPKQTVSSTKTAVKQSVPVFNFKSNGQAERRKEAWQHPVPSMFALKLEEKMHTKESQMNQVQAKTLEEREAEVKQVRRSLNFKATPMPSFYREAVHGSDKNKTGSCNTKSLRARCKASSSSAGAITRMSDCSAPVPFIGGASTSTRATHKKHPPYAEINTGIVGKKELEKAKKTMLPKHRVPDCSKVTKSHSGVGNKKVGTGIRSNDMVRKDMKTTGMECSGMGNVAVGVAS
ncbi:unnamed protein product [Ilex paraguariensis]|uniref:TPX2 C-terminal domain-containing protein n=1 Tax=Ilex paraguariensis TaxID=185542 RepID=A0ABC8SFA9_9AQUA